MSDNWGSLIPYFRELNNKQLKQIESISKVYSCKNGDLVYLQGEFCQNWVIINSGSFLTRVKKDDQVLFESVIHEGESFDFESTLDSSVTTRSLEAIGECSVLVIDILGLRKLGKKSPIIISLIKEQLEEQNSKVWEKRLLHTERKMTETCFKVRESAFSLFVKMFPIELFFVLVPSVFMYLRAFKKTLMVFLLLQSFFCLTYLFFYLLKRLTVIEVNREYAVKRNFDLKLLKAINRSVPIDKVSGTCISYKNRLYRMLRLGNIKFESALQELEIFGVFKPEKAISGIDNFKTKTLNINKAIEVSSFKSIYCEQNNLFYIQNQLEVCGNKDFSFRKSFLHFFIRGVPPFIIFLAISVGLFFVFNNKVFFLINIFSTIYLLWHYRDWINDKYAFEGAKVVDIEKKPLWGKEKRIEADIASVQSVKKEQKNFFEVLFNYGSIEVETLGESIVYPFIHNPDRVIENLYLVKQYYYSKKESLEKLNRQEEFLNFTKYYKELSGR